jgi:hypothetical protein
MKVIDVEIHCAIPPSRPSDGPREPDIWYCDGWRDFTGMGIGCVCTFDTHTYLSRAFSYADLPALAEHLQGEFTAGFNTLGFDIPLLRAHGIEIDETRHFDILAEIWKSLGLDPKVFNYRTHGGWGLDAICQNTFSGLSKSANGALAPIWWQRGMYAKTIDYCLRDVWMEWRLLKHAIEGREISNGRDKIALSSHASFLGELYGEIV